MFTIVFTDSAEEDLRYFAKRDQKSIAQKIEEQLLHEPLVETRNKGPMRPNQLAKWRIRHGKYRILYDVDEENQIVTVKAIGVKQRERFYLRGEEYEL